MYFVLSKVVGFLANPSSLVTLAVVVGGLMSLRERWATAGRRVVLGAGAALLLGGLWPFWNWPVVPLEQRFARPEGDRVPANAAGIIVLGGFEDGRLSNRRGGLALNEAAERITESIRLALKHPHLKLVHTGTSDAGLVLGNESATAALTRFMTDLGVAPGRIVIEDRSRTTWENAVFIRDMVRPKPGDAWLLVTSAMHMPRSVGVFRKAGVDVVPWPVDYRTAGLDDLTRPTSRLSDGWRRIDESVREWTGMLAYWATGRSSALFPAP